MLKLIQGGNDGRRADYAGVYKRIMWDNYSWWLMEGIGPARRMYLVRYVWAGVKYLSYVRHGDYVQNLEGTFNIFTNVIACMGQLSPADIAVMFPPTKEYKGSRDGCKDYFSAVQAIRDAGGDTFLEEDGSVIHFLMAYYNEDIMSFMVNLMCVLSAMRRQEGRNDLLTDFFLSQGKEPPVMVYEVDDGMGGKLLSDDHGNIMGRPHHHIPRYLRAVK